VNVRQTATDRREGREEKVMYWDNLIKPADRKDPKIKVELCLSFDLIDFFEDSDANSFIHCTRPMLWHHLSLEIKEILGSCEKKKKQLRF